MAVPAVQKIYIQSVHVKAYDDHDTRECNSCPLLSCPCPDTQTKVSLDDVPQHPQRIRAALPDMAETAHKQDALGFYNGMSSSSFARGWLSFSLKDRLV